MDQSNSEKVLVVESDNALRTSIASVLSDAGYEVSTDYQEGLKSVLTFNPDAVILGASPPQLAVAIFSPKLKVPCVCGTQLSLWSLREGLRSALGAWISALMMCCHCRLTLMNCCHEYDGSCETNAQLRSFVSRRTRLKRTKMSPSRSWPQSEKNGGPFALASSSPLSWWQLPPRHF